MGYRGKLEEQAKARDLRAQSWTLREIADELGVSKSSVSLWVRDVQFEPKPRKSGRPAKRQDEHPLRRSKLAEIQRLLDEGRECVGELNERDFLLAGAAIYAGEGFKTDGQVGLANTDPRFLAFFLAWLRHFFNVDESRLRVRLYLHAELDLDAAMDYWSRVTGIPVDQFMKPYRAANKAGVRRTKHHFGCPAVTYGCSRTHRAVMGLVHALLGTVPLPEDAPLPEEFEPFHRA